jgi:LysM repeat protein
MRRLKSGRLAVGQALVIPTPAVAAVRLAVPDPAIEKYPSSTARLKVHTVRRGETMRGIAKRYATTSERLMRINGLRKPIIFPGQTLLLTGNTSRASRATRARVAAIKARNEELAASRAAKPSGRAKVALSSKAVQPTTRKGVKASGAKAGKSAGATRSKPAPASKSEAKKRSGADPKASARTKSKNTKESARAR